MDEATSYHVVFTNYMFVLLRIVEFVHAHVLLTHIPIKNHVHIYMHVNMCI